MTTTTLNSGQRRYLRSLAHPLNVAVTVGQSGMTEAVRDEIDATLSHHELIKVKLPALDKAQRGRLLDEIAQRCDAHVVQQIGRVGVLYRRSDTPKLTLPESEPKVVGRE